MIGILQDYFVRQFPTEHIADISVYFATVNESKSGYEYQYRDCNKLFYRFSLEHDIVKQVKSYGYRVDKE